MAFYNKIKWILGISMVFMLILATNLIDRKNFNRLRDSVESIYEDRLIAKDIIFDISKLIQEKELAIALSDSSFYKMHNDNLNESIEDCFARYTHTKLTKAEGEKFDELRDNYEVLKASEEVFITSKFVKNETLELEIKNVKENLNDLSRIQLKEGRKQMTISNKAISDVEFFTQIEIYLLIFMAIVIQVIVMYKPKED